MRYRRPVFFLSALLLLWAVAAQAGRMNGSASRVYEATKLKTSSVTCPIAGGVGGVSGRDGAGVPICLPTYTTVTPTPTKTAFFYGPTLTATPTNTTTAVTPTPTGVTPTPTSTKTPEAGYGGEEFVWSRYVSCILATDSGGRQYCLDLSSVSMFGGEVDGSEWAAAVTVSSGHSLIFASGAALGLPKGTDCSAVSTSGYVCMDTDDGILGVADGTSWIAMVSTVANQVIAGFKRFTKGVTTGPATPTPGATPTLLAPTTAKTPEGEVVVNNGQIKLCDTDRACYYVRRIGTNTWMIGGLGYPIGDGVDDSSFNAPYFTISASSGITLSRRAPTSGLAWNDFAADASGITVGTNLFPGDEFVNFGGTNLTAAGYTVPIKANSAIGAGDVVCMSATADEYQTCDKSADPTRVVGVAPAAISSAGAGKIVVAGRQENVPCDGTVAVGDALTLSTVTNGRVQSAVVPERAFAVATTTCASSILTLMFGTPASVPARQDVRCQKTSISGTAWDCGPVPSPVPTGVAVANDQSTFTARAYGKFATAASSSSRAGIDNATPLIARRNYQPLLQARIATDSTAVTSQRIWVGLTSGALAAIAVSATPALNNLSVAAVGYEDGVNSGKWMCCVNDGSNTAGTCTTLSGSTAVASSTEYLVTIDITNTGAVVCRVNGLSVQVASDLPSGTADLAFQASTTTATSAARDLLFGSYDLTQN